MFTLLLCLVIFVSRHSPAEDKTIKLYPGAAHQVPTKRPKDEQFRKTRIKHTKPKVSSLFLIIIYEWKGDLIMDL